MHISSPAARAVPRLVQDLLHGHYHCFLKRYRDLKDPFKLAMRPMFYIGPTVGTKYFVRLTWNVLCATSTVS